MTVRFALRLPQHQARLLYLAIAYHLARPGSEVDPDTLAEYEHGLAEVKLALEPQLGAESAAVELTPFQLSRLESAMLSVINELHMYPVLDSMAGASPRRRSIAPGFDETLTGLFPQLGEDRNYASQLAEDMMMVRRQLAGTVKKAQETLAEERRQAEAARRRKKPWQFWKRPS
ncbi:MAG: hypothetical protein HYS09_05700 [Chloroflexi bacterium]|nr:hypothetical protein [Chloroflexota bacterium]